MLIGILVELLGIVNWVKTVIYVNWNMSGVVRNNELGGNCYIC